MCVRAVVTACAVVCVCLVPDLADGGLQAPHPALPPLHRRQVLLVNAYLLHAEEGNEQSGEGMLVGQVAAECL